ncbi:GAF domain-like protein [Poronia punctata]|nr:GAF domain-like protein [Poronia punctata]
MVHADASNFASGVTKQEAYEQVLLQAEGLFDGQRNWVCNLSNAASLLWHAYKSLPSPSQHVNWAGFYTIDTQETRKQQLILGPFQGKVACQIIAFGRGVCGTAASSQTTQLIPDVGQFAGHIACDADSKSEMVVPIVVGEGESKKVVAIIDVDCGVLDGFDEIDKKYLEQLAELLGRSCDWPQPQRTAPAPAPIESAPVLGAPQRSSWFSWWTKSPT